MNIWINEQVVIVIHLHTLCRACNVFCLQSVVLLSMGFLTQCLKQGRGEWEHRCSWVALLQRKNDLCLKMPPLSVFSASCYAPVPSFFFLQWLPCWHKDLPFAQMASSRGPPPKHTHTPPMSVKCCPPECVWDAALVCMPNWKERLEQRDGHLYCPRHQSQTDMKTSGLL